MTDKQKLERRIAALEDALIALLSDNYHQIAGGRMEAQRIVNTLAQQEESSDETA